MKSHFFVCLVIGLLCLEGACLSTQSTGVEEAGKKPSVSEQVGKLAYKVNKQAEKGARRAAKDLSKATAEARKGWKEAAKSDDK